MGCCGSIQTTVVTIDDDLSDWMRDLPTHLHEVPLCKLAIPGSHDSCTCHLRPHWKCSPDADAIVKFFEHFPGFDIITLRYGRCQDLTATGQLDAGIRYFDFRVAYRKQDAEYYFCHALYGPKVRDVLKEIRDFLDAHPQEVVLLDFNHFYVDLGKKEKKKKGGHKRVGPTSEPACQCALRTGKLVHSSARSFQAYWHGLAEVIEKTFQGKLCLKSQHHSSAKNISLRGLWEKQQQVIVCFQVLQNRDWMWPNPPSPWADTMNVKECLEKQAEKAAGRNKDSFYVCQAVLTPNVRSVVTHPCSSVRAQCADRINPKVKGWLRNFEDAPGMIYIADFVDTECFVQNVLELNHLPKTGSYKD